MIKKNKFNQRIISVENYYYFIFVIYFVSMFYNGIRVGYIASVLILCLVFLNRFQYTSFGTGFSRSFVIPILYIFWCAFSIAWFGFSGVGYESYVQAVSNSLVPTLFIFVCFADYDKFWQRMMNAYALAGFFGMYLLFLQPSWYTKYCLLRGFDFRRLSFAYGSIIMGNMGAVAVIIALRMIIKSGGKKGYIQYFLMCLFSFLSMQRSAWIVVALTLLIAHYYVFAEFKNMGIRFLVFEIIGLFVFFFIFKDQIMNVLDSWIDVHQSRYRGAITAQNTISERSYQWERGIANSNLINGSGFGSRGHKAAAGGFVNYVADGNWMLILCESGVIGLSLFTFSCINSVRKGIVNFKELFLPTGVIITFMLQAVGSNVWEQQLIAPLFWVAMGQIFRFRPKHEIICKGNIMCF